MSAKQEAGEQQQAQERSQRNPDKCHYDNRYRHLHPHPEARRNCRKAYEPGKAKPYSLPCAERVRGIGQEWRASEGEAWRLHYPTQPGIVRLTQAGHAESRWRIFHAAAADAASHSVMAADRNWRIILREIRWRWMLKVL